MTDLALQRPTDGVAILTMNRPDRRNALSIALRDAVTEALGNLSADTDVRVVGIIGNGESFCAGFDTGEFALLENPAGHQRLWASSDRFHRAWLEFPLPTVAIINGPALGGGFDLVAMCDLRIAAEGAYFAHPEHAYGDVVYRPLHEAVGGAIARDLVFTGRRMTADEALRHGLVSALHPRTHLLDAGIALCQQIAKAPREALLRTTAKVRDRTGITLGDQTAATLTL